MSKLWYRILMWHWRRQLRRARKAAMAAAVEAGRQAYREALAHDQRIQRLEDQK